MLQKRKKKKKKNEESPKFVVSVKKKKKNGRRRKDRGTRSAVKSTKRRLKKVYFACESCQMLVKNINVHNQTE